MMELWGELITIMARLIAIGIGVLMSTIVIPWVTNELIPWLHEKRIYAIVSKFVRAAEKMHEAGNLVGLKKEFVTGLLVSKGIVVTPEVDAFIESAVKELDIAINSGLGEIVDEFVDEDDYDGDLPFSEPDESETKSDIDANDFFEEGELSE